MRIIDIIEKKRDGLSLDEQEIKYAIDGYVKGEIPDYQVSALLMAIYLKGMNDIEATHLTKAMLFSGETIDLSMIKGVKVDKHSTGGVGDKTTLVLGPLVASMGAKLAKLSGRGLGHTGGTLDKLESIEGCSIDLSPEHFIDQVNKINIAVSGQTASIVPADKLLYALRDVTGTVSSIPLIASSIMSKKLASGADIICLDVKIGGGAFMKTIEEGILLSRLMVAIGKGFNKKVFAILSGMDQPLGYAIGNRLEVKEAIDTLSGKGPQDLEELCSEIAAEMVFRGGLSSSKKEALALASANLKNGLALKKFYQFIEAQGGHIDNLDEFVKVRDVFPYRAKTAGLIARIDALSIGLASMRLGGGREIKEDVIDPMVGIVLKHKIGDKVSRGDVLCEVYANKPIDNEILSLLDQAFCFSEDIVKMPKVIEKIIG
ncbi:MAG: pyrimidine-nucleoside phosphorylase [Candidatus Izemoplasmatales bacterium]|nr:pyrimidine-nucleoside phosphorylase [Candidatus Izemoplasmatales bacterium]